MFKQANPGSFPPMERITCGTETYGAPECDRARSDQSIKVSQTIDTWSFGCVLSVSATWVVLGYPGVVRYHKHRQIAIQKLKKKQANGKNISVPVGDDAFHNGFVVLPEVKEWHDYLRIVSRRSDTITPRILDLVENTMLLDESSRLSKAKALYPALEEQLRLARAEPVTSVAESVKEALLTIEDDESPLMSSPGFEASISATNSVVSDYQLTPASSIDHRPRYNRINKSKKIGEVVQGKVAHRQEALKMDEKQRSKSIAQAAQQYPMTENGPRDLGSWYVRRPAQSLQPRGLNPSSFTTGLTHGLAHPFENPFLDRPQNSYIETEMTSSGSLQPMSTSSVRNPLLGHESLLTESPTKEFNSTPIPVSGSHSLRVRPRLSTHQEMPQTPGLLNEFSLDPSWPIYIEHAAQKDKRGFRGLLSKKVPDDYLKNFLVNRDIKFLVDNDSTMITYWRAMSIVIETLVSKVKLLDKDGLDIEFTVGHQHNAHSVSDKRLLSRFEGAKQEASSRRYLVQTDMAKVLTRIFDDYLRNPRRAMTLIVLTDGRWEGTSDIRSVEKAIAEFLKRPALASKLEKRWFTIQFISLGYGVPDILVRLDDGIGKEYSIPDVVDTEHVSGSVEKMILGSFVDQYDSAKSSSGLSTRQDDQSYSTGDGLSSPYRLSSSVTIPVTRRESTRSSRVFSGLGFLSR
ncbi:hypothetical protein F4774DRAFT_421439 [Daldinia eschscholtzii]|nr:hypothetical protein F4774DRAFT_421439 [Daldinia eschscholtzii]